MTILELFRIHWVASIAQLKNLKFVTEREGSGASGEVSLAGMRWKLVKPLIAVVTVIGAALVGITITLGG